MTIYDIGGALLRAYWKLTSFRGVSAFGLPNPGPVAIKAVDDANTKAVLSVREEGRNAGRYVLTYLKSVFLGAGNPWCQAFVCYRLIKAAHTLGTVLPKDFPKTGSTVVMSNWGKKKGWWISRADVELKRAAPMKGDLAFFYKPSLGRIGHVGLVLEVTDQGVWTVEGNTGPSAGNGVNRDGDGVYKKFRPWNALGLKGGFVRLPF